MNAIAAIITTMRAKGMSDTDILDVVQAMAAAMPAAVMSGGMSGGIPVDEAAERRRAYDRERKREKRMSGGMSGGIPVDSSLANMSAVSGGIPRNSGGSPVECPNPYISNKEDTKKVSKRERRGTRLPPDWIPDAELVAYASGLGLSAKQFDVQVERFRNYWLAASGDKGVKRDWAATFRNWMLTAAERLGSQATVATKHTTTRAVWVPRGSEAWAAWTKHRGKEPLCTHNGGDEGQWMPTEYPPQENAA